MDARQEYPIGIFDSGIGGLTVATAISKVLPDEQLVYFGDTAHLPYGDKSLGLIQEYSIKIAKFLIEVKNCKAIVIACNTASAAAYSFLRDELKGKLPVINVIDPMVEFVIQNPNIHHVGIIATKTTIASGVYQEKLSRRKSDLIYSTLATPLLAPMIEEGFIHNSISQSVLHEYLGHHELQDIDSLVLACTHYPLIKKEISDYYQDKILILDSAEIVAAKLKMIMQKEQLLNNNKIHMEHQLYVSDLTTSFQETTKVFYGQRIALREKKL